MSETRRTFGGEYVGVLEFDADELRGIAAALGPHDVGAQDMLSLADELDALNREAL